MKDISTKVVVDIFILNNESIITYFPSGFLKEFYLRWNLKDTAFIYFGTFALEIKAKETSSNKFKKGDLLLRNSNCTRKLMI